MASKPKNSKIDKILQAYQKMTNGPDWDADWSKDKKWITGRILEAKLLGETDARNLWRCFEYVHKNLREKANWNEQKKLIKFLLEWARNPD
jgi:hypothetical protein